MGAPSSPGVTNPNPPDGHDRVREYHERRIRMVEETIARHEKWIARCQDDPDPDFQYACEIKRQRVDESRARLYWLQHEAVEAGVMDAVTVEYPERLHEQERVEYDVLDKAACLPRHVQQRFNGRALIDLAHDRTFNRLVDRYTPVTTTTTHPRARERRAGTARRTSSSSSSSGTDPGDDGSDEPPAALGYCDCCSPARPIRLCACGCQREVTHKRADATTFGASCRQRLKRANECDVCNPLEPRFCQCDSGFFYRDEEGHAVCGACGCWLGKVSGPVTDEHPDYHLAAYLLYTNHRSHRAGVVSCS